MLDRERLIEEIAESAADAMDLGDLIQYFRDSQIEYMESLTDTDLMDHAEIYLHDFEEEDYQTEEE